MRALSNSPRRTGRLAAVVLLALALVVTLAPAAPAKQVPAKSSSPGKATRVESPGAHLRIELTSTSDWSRVWIDGIIFHASHIVGDGAGVSRTDSWVRVDGQRTGVVEAIAPLPTSGSVGVRLHKGTVGTAHVVVRQVDASGASKVLADLTTSGSTSATNEVAATVPVSTLLASAVELGATDPERLVIAAFYPWWDGSERSAFTPDRPVGDWTTSTTEAIRSQLAQMAGVGIDVAAVSMGWPDAKRQRMIATTIEAAQQQRAVRLVPYVELEVARSPGGWNEPYLEAIIGTTADIARALPDTFVHRDGRPVLFFFADQQIPTDVWNRVMANVEAAHGTIFAVTHSFDSAQRSDGIHSYEDRGTTYERWMASFRRKVVGRYQPMIDPSHHERVVVSTVMPGIDDSSITLLFPRQTLRGEGTFYNETWDLALGAEPDWVFITSWNEWWEQTHVAPSELHGTTSLQITQQRAAEFRS